MKRLRAVTIILFFGLILAGCGENSSTWKSIALTGSEEVSKNVFDDQQSTLYIRVDNLRPGGADASIADIMTKKKYWEKRFPNKKIVAMSIVTGDEGGYYGRPIVVGLLIHYEQR